MNKNIIALAVAAGFAAPMSANAAPTLYGHLQMELTDQEVCVAGTCASGNIMDDKKRGRLGVKGSEDLGNGLSAIYKFEWQVDTSKADVDDGDREAFVGLKGDMGTFIAGSVKSAYKYTGGVKYDPFVATYLEARSRGGMSGKVTDLGSPAKGAFGHHGFLTNNMSYQNKFDKVSIWLTTSLDETGAAKGNDGDLTAAIKYKAKSWEIFAATASDDAVGVSTDDYTATKFGGQWKSGAHKLSAQLENTEYTSGGVGAEADVLFVGYQFKMGKNVFVASYGNTDWDAVPVETDYLAFGVIHKYSKKSRVFAGLSTSDNDLAGVSIEDNTVSLGMRVDF